jgi:hypothetical protein
VEACGGTDRRAASGKEDNGVPRDGVEVGIGVGGRSNPVEDEIDGSVFCALHRATPPNVEQETALAVWEIAEISAEAALRPSGGTY